MNNYITDHKRADNNVAVPEKPIKVSEKQGVILSTDTAGEFGIAAGMY